LNHDYLNCAREIHQTVRRLQERITSQFVRAGKDTAEGALSDLTLTQCNALLTIRDHGELTIKDFAERLHVSAPSASVMADKLVELGMVERRPNPLDRRAVLINASPRGVEAITTLEKELYAMLVGIMERLGDEQAHQWRDIYQRIGAILTEDEDPSIPGAESAEA